MSTRSLVMFDHDNLEILIQDPDIGRKLFEAIMGYGFSHDGRIGNVGQVVEASDGNVAKLVIIGENGKFDITELAMVHSVFNDSNQAIELLERAAANFEFGLYPLGETNTEESAN